MPAANRSVFVIGAPHREIPIAIGIMAKEDR